MIVAEALQGTVIWRDEISDEFSPLSVSYMLSGNLIPLPQIAYITAKTHRLQSANVPD